MSSSLDSVSVSSTIAPQPSITTIICNLDPFTRLFLLFVFLTLFIRVCYIYFSTYYGRGHNPSPSTQHHRGDDHNTGLPIDIINSYHTFPYSKNNILNNNKEHDTTCSICISDYKESEMLRMMPHCPHYFHRDCVDAWLKVKGSCPICRSSPMELAV